MKNVRVIEEHYFGHCGAEGHGSRIYQGEIFCVPDDFGSERDFCKSCGGYSGNIADPRLCEDCEKD